ncbi:MAG: C-type lectin domain-containing protein [Rhodospirillaceae bacterium]|nr:C-type lectin domain-containing protein [Rhodospirillaceae bacterium]
MLTGCAGRRAHLFRVATICAVAALCLSARGAAGQTFEDPDTGHRYEHFDAPTDWVTAAEACAALGGYLATITSPQENQAIHTLARDCGGYGCWIGAAETGTEGAFSWITGEPWTYANWDSGEPNEYCPGEDFAHIRQSGRWNDQEVDGGCSGWGLMGYICEWPGPAVAEDAAGEPRPVPDVTIVVLADDGSGATIPADEALPFGVPLAVELRYAEAPEPPPPSATLSIGDGPPRRLSLAPHGPAGTVFRSGPVILIDEAACFGLAGCLGAGVEP